jgi:acetylglutamate kinase
MCAKKTESKSGEIIDISDKSFQRALVISEALPYIKKFAGETFVVKYGGSAMGSDEIMQLFAKDVVLLKSIGIDIVVVHGGGPQISQMLDKLKLKSSFVEGLRITDKETVEIAEMVLCGSINKQIVCEINKAGGLAIGISGKDANLIKAEKVRKTYRETDSNIERIIDLGFVGKPSTVNIDFFEAIDDTSLIPVIAPVGFGDNGQTYNMNADTVAGAIAVALSAKKLIILSDTDGVLDKDKKLMSTLTKEQAKAMIDNGSIHSGMIPKVDTCLGAVVNGVESAHIINGNRKHALLLEILTDEGTGTMISGGSYSKTIFDDEDDDY